MKAIHAQILVWGLALLVTASLALTIGLPVLASQAGYTLDWWTVDGGGVTSNAGGGYTLDDTIGQPDAGLWSGGGYTLVGGFWGGAAAGYNICLPLVLRNYP